MVKKQLNQSTQPNFFDKPTFDRPQNLIQQ
jgi:hypothetical protein